MKKIISIALLLFLVTTILQVSAQELDTRAIAFELRRMNNKTSQVCSDAIKEYRAEAIREIQEQKENFQKDIHKLVRNQKVMLFVGVGLSSFIGACLAILINESLNSKMKKEIKNQVKIGEKSKNLLNKEKGGR